MEDKGKRISILPADSFRLTCDTDFPHPLVGRQSLEMEVTPERYATALAPCAHVSGASPSWTRCATWG